MNDRKEANISESGKTFNLIVGAGMTTRKPINPKHLINAKNHLVRLHTKILNIWFLRAVMPAPTKKP